MTTATEIAERHDGSELELAPPRRRRPPTGRWWTLWSVAVVVLAVVVAGIVYVVSNHLPATYQSSAVVSVSVQATAGISDQAVTAANDLASQYAQLASTSPVITAAERRLRASLSGASVTAGTIAAQNLIRISVTGTSALQAQARATAVTRSFVVYIDSVSARQAADYANVVAARLRPLDRDIAAAREQLTSGSVDAQRNATVLLSGLVSQRQQVASAVAQSSAAALPDIQLIATGSGGSKTSPKPKLYAGVGFAVVLLLLGRLLFVVGTRRTRSAARP